MSKWAVTWRAMIAGAKRSIAIGEFYVAEKPKDAPFADKLGPVIEARLRSALR